MFQEPHLDTQSHLPYSVNTHRSTQRDGGVGTGETAPAVSWRHGAVRRLAAKEHLFCEGDFHGHICQVVEGVIMAYKVLADGRRQVIGFAYPGDLLGLGSAGEHTFSAQAAGPATVRCLSAAAVEAAARHDAGLAMKLYQAVSAELAVTRGLLISLGQGSAMERVAAFLLSVYQRTRHDPNGAAVIALPMRRTDIADLLGLTIETVSRTLTRLRLMGILDAVRGSEVSLRDLPRLEKLARG